MNTARWGLLTGAAAVLVIGVAAAIGSLRLGYWKDGPGPGFFPMWLGILLATLALVWVWQILRAEPKPPEEPAQQVGHRDLLLVVAGLTALVLLLDVVGYQLTMFLFTLYTLLLVGRRKPLGALVVAGLAGFGVYALFANVLQVYLPTASLGFLAQLGL
jgi:putative tricarboxylic transport membrane protein